MKEYPSIDRPPADGPVYTFPKYDGSNVRTEWTRKSGMSKFGSRTRLLGIDERPLGEAIPLMREHEAEATRLLHAERVEKAVLYFEFFGENSFAGVHLDEPHRVVLIDASFHPKGIVDPRDFIRVFDGSGIPTAPCIYRGNANSDFIRSVRQGTLPGMTFEGVVCKQSRSKPSHPPAMFKVKSEAWIEKVRSLYTDASKLEELL